MVRLEASLGRDGYKGTPQPINRPLLRNQPGARSQNHFQGNKRPWNNGKRPQQTLPQNQQATLPAPQGLPAIIGNNANNEGCFNYGILGHMARDCTAPRVRNRDAVIYYNCDKREHMSKDYRAPRGQYHGPIGRGQVERARLNAIIPEATGYDDGEQQDLEGTLLLFNS